MTARTDVKSRKAIENCGQLNIFGSPVNFKAAIEYDTAPRAGKCVD
jgi:hypothetical protein